MKKIYQTFIVLFLFCSSNIAQNNKNLNMTMVIKTPDMQIITLHSKLVLYNPVVGYFFQPHKRMDYQESASIGITGFPFLEDDMFAGINEWISQVFTKEQISKKIINNTINVSKMLSFRIRHLPIILAPNSLQQNLSIKYAIMDFVNQNENYNNFSLKLYYKQILLPVGKVVPLDFFNKEFEGYSFNLKLEKEDSLAQLKLNSKDPLFIGIMKSVQESKLTETKFLFRISLVKKKNPALNNNYYEFVAKYEEDFIPSIKSIFNSDLLEKHDLPINIYYSELNFPFTLYNQLKKQLYKKYATYRKILKSKCKIIIVPISLNKGNLLADVFIDYKKIKLDDNIKRWTPIKKRIQIPLVLGRVSINLPKENWSANFTRKGEHYDIYGYSDYERYINEYLNIKILNKERLK